MQTTTYKCDRCGAEDTTNAIRLQEVTIGIPWSTLVEDYSRVGNRGRPVVQWCRKCLVETGVIQRHSELDAALPNPLPPPPSLEDMVREIVREELVYIQQQ